MKKETRLNRIFPLAIALMVAFIAIGCSIPNPSDSILTANSRSLSGNDLMTTFLPENGQSHEIGQLSKSINLDWIKTWTVAWCSPAGSMLKTAPVTLAEGKHTGLYQVWHKQKAGRYLGELRVWANGQLISSKELISESITDYLGGGYQRAVIDFNLTEDSADVVLELYYGGNNRYLWTGAVNITPTETRRPFYNIGHRCSTINTVNDMVNRHANAIECDITPELKDGKIEFKVYHIGDLPWTPSNQFGAYLENIKRHFDDNKITFFMFDCKQVNGIAPADYARALAQRAIDAGLQAEYIAFSVPEDIAGIFYETLKTPDEDGNILYDAGIDSYLLSYSGLTENSWVNQVEEIGATFIGVGEVSYSPTPMANWMPWIQAQTNRRDAGLNFKKAYFWTLNRAVSMRKCVDYGVDGIITNNPERMYQVMNETPYNQIIRPATQADSQFKVHGFEN